MSPTITILRNTKQCVRGRAYVCGQILLMNDTEKRACHEEKIEEVINEILLLDDEHGVTLNF